MSPRYELYAENPATSDVWTLLHLRTVHAPPDTPPLEEYRRQVHHEPGGALGAATPFDALVHNQQLLLDALGLLAPPVPLAAPLPVGSAFLQLRFTLAKPYISRDDDPYYIAEGVNPVRKGRPYPIPMVAASSWKGLLRWTAMQRVLVENARTLDDDAFARERFAQVLLFGDEKGEEPARPLNMAAFLNALKPGAVEPYHDRLRRHFHVRAGDPLPHHAGHLYCYPTFFDSIDMEVINPHARDTKAGTHPIYLECARTGAAGTFSLLYVPVDLVDAPERRLRGRLRNDLRIIADAATALLLRYGFSAKRSSGYGVANDVLADEGCLAVRWPRGAEAPGAAPWQTHPFGAISGLPRMVDSLWGEARQR